MSSPSQNVPIRVVGLAGSLRPGSYTRMALEVALEGARQAGAQTSLLSLQEYELGFADGDDSRYPPGVFRLRSDVRAAQGIIVATPEYHGSFSGVLKNALDLMGFEEFEGKMLGLVGVSAGQMGAYEALNSLRTIGRALHAWVVPEQAAIARVHNAFNAAGRPIDPAIAERLLGVGRQVGRFARLHHCADAMSFLKEWETAPENPGAA